MSAILYKDKVYGAGGSGGGGASAVSDLTDVELTDLSDGQVLKWDGTEEKWKNANESGGGGSSEMLAPTPFIYSEEEQQVGIWIDGKPLYQKTIINNNGISNTETWTEIADIGNTCDIKLVDGKISTAVGEVPFDYYGQGANVSYIANMSASVIKTYGKISAILNSGANWLRNLPLTITLQYTKTTDTAGSGKYTTLGVPTVHYDDTERVIGTWFGKPLYRKAWTGQSIFLGWQGGSAANYTTGTWQNNDVADMKLLVNLKLIGANGLCDTPMGTKSASTTITLFSKIQDTYDTIILEYTKTTD